MSVMMARARRAPWGASSVESCHRMARRRRVIGRRSSGSGGGSSPSSSLTGGYRSRLGGSVGLAAEAEELFLLRGGVAAAERDQVLCVVAVEEQVREQVVLAAGLAGGELLDQAAGDAARDDELAAAHEVGRDGA